MNIKRVFSYLGAFAKCRKAIIFFHHVRPSVRMEQLDSHWWEFHEIRHLNIIQKSVKQVQVLIKSGKDKSYFTRIPIYILPPVKWVPDLSPGLKCGRGVLLTTHPLLVPRSWNSTAIPLPTLWATPGL